MVLREVEYKFNSGHGIWQQLWGVEIELEWHRMGIIRDVVGYIEKDNKEWKEIMNNNDSSDIEIENVVMESARKAEKEDKTVITWLMDNNELVKVANKTLQTVKNRYFFRRCKRQIGGSVLRKHGVSWIRVGDGVFVPVHDGDKYPVDRITGVLFEHQHPHPFSVR